MYPTKHHTRYGSMSKRHRFDIEVYDGDAHRRQLAEGLAIFTGLVSVVTGSMYFIGFETVLNLVVSLF